MRHERFEGAEKLRLRALGAREGLHVVDQEKVERAVAFVELLQGLLTVGRARFACRGRKFVDEVLRGNAADLGLWVKVEIAVPDGLHEVGLPQTDAP